MITFCNSYILWLLRCVQLRLVTVTFCDVNVVWCYVLSQYPLRPVSYCNIFKRTPCNFLHGFENRPRVILCEVILKWGGTRPPLSLYLPSRAKLWCTLQLRGQKHSSYFSSTLFSSVGAGPREWNRRCALFLLNFLRHGLISYTDTKGFCRLFLKIDPQENSLALICHPSRNCLKKTLMVKDHYQLCICIVIYVYN